MTLIRLALKSLWYRRKVTGLLVLVLALGLYLVFAIPHLEEGVKRGLSNAISGTSLIVGARGSPLNLALYSIFHLGDPTNNVGYPTYQKWRADPRVEWTIPLSLGDSHRGYRVVGTTAEFFEHFQFAGKQHLSFRLGKPFENSLEVVIGAEIARRLNYGLGSELTLAHGLVEIPGTTHDAFPFRVVGILNASGTPVDRALYVSLKDLDLLHEIKATESITSFLVRVSSPRDLLALQREINTESAEALSAVIPGVALSELWKLLSYASLVLLVVGALSVIVALLLLATIFSIQVELRKREFAILAQMGMKKLGVMKLITWEALISTGLAVLLSQTLLQASKPALEAYALSTLGFSISFPIFLNTDLQIALVTLGAAFILSLIPVIRLQLKIEKSN